VYIRKSSEEGLEQDFIANSPIVQAAASQRHELGEFVDSLLRLTNSLIP
jgi:hypothetical protein